MPLVSICIPAYNAEKYIAEALSSVRNQSFTDWELILVEDGSKDSTEKIVTNFAKEVSQRVIYQRHEDKQGPSASRNSCIKKADGEYIALLDADDYWAISHLETIVSHFLRSNADIVHSGSILFDDATGKELEIRAPLESQTDNFLISLYNHSYIIQPSSVVLRKKIFSKAGFFDHYFHYCEDMEYWFRAARAGCLFSYTGQNTCYYRKHDSALTAKSIKMTESFAEVYDKYLDWEAISKAVRLKKTTSAFASAGRMHFRQNPSRSSLFYYKAWKINPFQMQYFTLALIGKVLNLLK